MVRAGQRAHDRSPTIRAAAYAMDQQYGVPVAVLFHPQPQGRVESSNVNKSAQSGSHSPIATTQAKSYENTCAAQRWRENTPSRHHSEISVTAHQILSDGNAEMFLVITRSESRAEFANTVAMSSRPCHHGHVITAMSSRGVPVSASPRQRSDSRLSCIASVHGQFGYMRQHQASDRCRHARSVIIEARVIEARVIEARKREKRQTYSPTLTTPTCWLMPSDGGNFVAAFSDVIEV